jgi:hypothetical protein
MRLCPCFLAGVFALGGIGAVAASPRVERPRLPIGACIADNEAERQACLRLQLELRAHFSAAWRGENNAQRRVAFCLSTGCGGALIANPILGCAWRIVILASGSAGPDQNTMPISNANAAVCRRLRN